MAYRKFLDKEKDENNKWQLEITEIDYESRYLFEQIAVSKHDVESECTSIAFINVGDVHATISGIPLRKDSPMLSFQGEPTVLDKTVYNVVFDPDTIGTSPLVLVIRRFITRI